MPAYHCRTVTNVVLTREGSLVVEDLNVLEVNDGHDCVPCMLVVSGVEGACDALDVLVVCEMRL